MDESLSVKGLADRIVWTAKHLGELAGKNENELVKWFTKTVRDSAVRRFIATNVNEILMALQGILLSMPASLLESEEPVNSVVILAEDGKKLYVVLPGGTEQVDVDMDTDDFLALFERYCSGPDVIRTTDKTFICRALTGRRIVDDLKARD